MSTIKSHLESSTLGPEYSYLIKKQSFLANCIKKLFEVFCRTVFTFYCPLTVKGRENIPGSPFIYCSNHNSHMDSAVLMASSRKGFKNFGMIAAKDYFFDNKIRKYFLNLLMNLIPIDRKSGRKAIIDHLVACRAFVNNGQRSLIIYPEGTRSITGEIQPFKKGPAIISVELGIPMVPAYIVGTYNSMSKGKNFVKPGKICIWIGESVYPDQYLEKSDSKNDNNFKTYRRVTEEIENRIHKLMESSRHGKKR